ncbi:MAG: pyrroline-5-carboxylate reductase [Candidatus Omnitrophota bacterium]|nr:pyrroline-5-carboxylate reductase [Candidatus Omnitrophota bacterium]
MSTITIIGGGNMGEALVKGLYRTHKVCVCEADPKRARALKNKYRIAIAGLHTAIKNAEIVIFAVKPQDMAVLLVHVGAIINRPQRQIFISIAAGLTTKFFEKHLGKVRVVRAMPNMPALIGEGMTALCAGRYASSKDLAVAQKILSSVGKTMVVKEKYMDAVTAVSGSGPAYVFLFVEQWMAAAKALGFKDVQAKALVYQTLTGSAHLLEKSVFDAATLRAKVTSKGGTTQAALDVFSQAKFDHIMKKALLAAKKRASQLAK